MLALPAAFQSKLDAGATTLAHAWIVRRRDGVISGYTDHDRDLTVDGVTCHAGSGFGASEATSRFNLSTDGAEIAGALAAQSLTEADLAAGRYDAASIETWLVDWNEPSLAVRQASSILGEIKREGEGFSAELRGPGDRLAQECGRLYTARCNADLGDARCRADLGDASRRGTGHVIASVGTAALVVSGLDAFVSGMFNAGRLVWIDGANAGLSMEIKEHWNEAGAVRIVLWQAMPETIETGDGFTLTAGCDKRFETCRDRFANAENFRGFPHIPGNDFLMRGGSES